MASLATGEGSVRELDALDAFREQFLSIRATNIQVYICENKPMYNIGLGSLDFGHLIPLEGIGDRELNGEFDPGSG